MDFVRQLVHICGTSWTHHRIVPMVPRTVAATGMVDWGAMSPCYRFPRTGGGEEAGVMACVDRPGVLDYGTVSGLDISAVMPMGIVGQQGAGSALFFGSSRLFLAIEMTTVSLRP